MSSASFLARRNGYLNSHDNEVALDNGELDQREVEENEAASLIDQVSRLVDEKVNDTQVVSKT